VRIWIDITNSPHVRFFAPLIAELEARGHEVSVTAREYAQTVSLLEREEIPYVLIGRHRGMGIGRPRFWERAAYYNLERELADALDSLNSA
jgi:predicted glycosyltransferase